MIQPSCRPAARVPGARVAAIAAGVLAVAAALVPPVAASAAPLPPRLGQVLRSQAVPPAAASFVVRDARTGAVLLSHQGRTPRSPASTIKVLTTFAALDELGPAYTWRTRAWATGPVDDGRLRGDLVIEGGGDPFMTADRWWRFARELRNRGLRRIEGDVVLDRSIWELAPEDPAAFDGQGHRTYNVAPDPLLVNWQSAEFTFVPRADRIDVVVDPSPANFALESSVRVTEVGCRAGLRTVTFAGFDDAPERLLVGGRLSSRCPPLSLRRVIMRAPEFAYGTFVTNWREGGGELAGRLRLDRRPPDAALLVQFESLTLGEVVRLVNKHSSNAMARTLVLTLGAERGGLPGTVAKGEAAMQAWLARRRIDLPELVIDNGSGLSRAARISADGLARVLLAARGSPYWPELAASLPLGGQDGTLRTRFADLADEGRVRLKTGMLDDVAAVAGYVTSRTGRPLVVVAIVNHPGADAGAGQAVIDTVVRWALEK